ncbi:MAG: hypothetical protein R3C56_14930 [Pirellulaceae bacterium]
MNDIFSADAGTLSEFRYQQPLRGQILSFLSTCLLGCCFNNVARRSAVGMTSLISNNVARRSAVGMTSLLFASLLSCCLSNWTSATETAPPFLIAENGQPTCVIVVADQPSASEHTAATELQSILKQVTGAELPMRTSTEVDRGANRSSSDLHRGWRTTSEPEARRPGR